MKAVNFWKTLLFSVMALGAFTGCNNDDDPNEGGGIPSITVNGEKSTSVALDYEGGTTSEIEVVSTGSWTLTFSDASATWCTPSVVSGNKGTTKLTFSAEATTVDREITATLATSGSIEGIPMEAKATIVIKQNAGGIAPSDALYIENCGEDVDKNGNYWPYTDQFTGWSRKGSLDQSDVTYSGSGTTVSNSGKNYAPADDERGVVSDAPYTYMGKASNVLNIENVNIGSNTSFTFTFTAQVQASYGSGPTFTAMTPSMVKLAVAAGELDYAPVEYTVKQVATGSWYLCTAEFKLPATVTTDKISIRFDSFAYAAGKADQLRMDDFTLYAGGNGAELQPETAKVVTIDQITDTSLYEVQGATVVATYQRGFVIQDATGAILVYKSEDVAVGDVVTVSGKVSEFGGALQFSNATVTKTGSTTYTPGTPEAVTSENIESMMTSPKVQYVKMTGKLVVDGSYNNVIFDFHDTYQGSISYPNEDLNVSSFNGKTVEVLGWFVNVSSNKYLTIVATAISEVAGSVSGSFTDSPKTFAATSPEAQTLAFTASEAAGAVSFAITGENADMFSYDYTAGETKVTVSAKGDNTSEAAYKATLQLKAADDTVLDEVSLTQAAPASGAGYTMIDKVADLVAGTYYMSGFSEKYSDTTFAPYSYHVWTGAVSGSSPEKSNSDLITVGYEYASSQLTADPSATNQAAMITLEAVAGAENTYYIKSGDKYLKVFADANRRMGLADTSEGAEWTFSDHEKGGIQISNPNGSNVYILGTAGAQSNMLRSYKSPATSLVYGVCFFKAN